MMQSDLYRSASSFFKMGHEDDRTTGDEKQKPSGNAPFFLKSGSWRFITNFIAGILVCLASPVAKSQQTSGSYELHVPPSGLDSNPGTVELPVATLEKARDLLRSRSADGQAKGNSVVRLQAGTYLRKGPFKLGKQDSSPKGTRISYRAEGTVQLVGGTMIPTDAFKPVQDPQVLTRLPEDARKHVVALDLNALGIINQKPFPDLFRGSRGII